MIVGIVVGLLVLVVLVTVICCCCLPFCFLAKKRNARKQEEAPNEGEEGPAPAGQAGDGPHPQDSPQYAFQTYSSGSRPVYQDMYQP